MNNQEKSVFVNATNNIGAELGRLNQLVDSEDPEFVALQVALVKFAHKHNPSMMTIIAMSRIEEHGTINIKSESEE